MRRSHYEERPRALAGYPRGHRENPTKKVNDRAQFDLDELLQIWFVHHFQIIGEAASRISSSLRKQYPDVPWGKMIGMRHILVHGYFDVDLDIIWNAVQDNLAQLKEQIEDILRHMREVE